MIKDFLCDIFDKKKRKKICLVQQNIEKYFDNESNYETICSELTNDSNLLYMLLLLSLAKQKTDAKNKLCCELLYKSKTLVDDEYKTAINWHLNCIETECQLIAANEKQLNHKNDNLLNLNQTYRFQYLYNDFLKEGLEYNINSVCSFLDTLDGNEVYLFVWYSILREETISKHLTAADTVIYLSPIVYDEQWTMVFWHIRQAIKINKESRELANYIVSNFKESPDSIWSEDEMKGWEYIASKSD